MNEIVEQIKRSAYNEGVIDTLNRFLEEVPTWVSSFSVRESEYGNGYISCCERVLGLVKEIKKELES
jgi:hypothetical protein